MAQVLLAVSPLRVDMQLNRPLAGPPRLACLRGRTLTLRLESAVLVQAVQALGLNARAVPVIIENLTASR